MVQMKGQGVVGCVQPLADGSGSQATGASLYQQTEGPQPGFLGQGVKHGSGLVYFHMSRVMDIIMLCQPLFREWRPPYASQSRLTSRV